jgi:hypothetical protein
MEPWSPPDWPPLVMQHKHVFQMHKRSRLKKGSKMHKHPFWPASKFSWIWATQMHFWSAQIEVTQEITRCKHTELHSQLWPRNTNTRISFLEWEEYTVKWSIIGSPKYFGSWALLMVCFLCGVLSGPWCTNQAHFGLDFFRIEGTFLWSHLTMSWMPLKWMAPWKQNFESRYETLEVIQHGGPLRSICWRLWDLVVWIAVQWSQQQDSSTTLPFCSSKELCLTSDHSSQLATRPP